MTLKNCINRAVDDGISPAAKQQDLINDFDANYKKYLDQGMSEKDAARLAGIDTYNT